MRTEEDVRKAALVKYKIVTYLTWLLSGGLLIIAFISAIKYPDDVHVYYIGGFIGGFPGLLQALLCIFIVVKGQKKQEEITAREHSCMITGQFVMSGLLFTGCVTGTILAGIGGFRSHHSGTIEVLAAAILGGCILELVLHIFGFFLMHTLIDLCKRHEGDDDNYQGGV